MKPRFRAYLERAGHDYKFGWAGQTEKPKAVWQEGRGTGLVEHSGAATTKPPEIKNACEDHRSRVPPEARKSISRKVPGGVEWANEMDVRPLSIIFTAPAGP